MSKQTLHIKFWRRLNNFLVSRIKQSWKNRLCIYVADKYTKAFYDANPPE